ncbi:hypothetical protein ACEWY4_011928 [Coilia grayii]|uniref:Reverse transcriptase/retrotransposon-derived protein RNase H-like domain-containing protein n=1 Tax=Coilia grayii TaxID=363190 RepID=A0ABD1JZ64_9TELE
MGLAGWYHQLIPGFSQVEEPINALKRKGRTFQWSNERQKAFDTLKGHLTSPPILGHPDFNYPFVVCTDASDVGLGTVLTQKRVLLARKSLPMPAVLLTSLSEIALPQIESVWL